MAGSGVGSIIGNILGSGTASRVTARGDSLEVFSPSGQSGVRGGSGSGSGLRHPLVNIDSAEMDTQAPRGTYLDILV